MATIERDIVMTGKTPNGDDTIDFPVTRAENVEGLSENYVALDADGRIPADKLPTELSKNADTADKLRIARTIQTNLTSTAAANFDGSTDVTPGVTGTLPIANGGTGATTPADARAKLGAAAKPTVATVTLTAADWTGDAEPYTQAVTVSGILADESKQLIQPIPAEASKAVYAESGVYASAQAANSLTFSCNTKPTANLTVYVVVQEVD